MRTDTAPAQTPEPTRLSDYAPPNFKIESVYLDFDLRPKATRIRSKLSVTRLAPGPLELDGENIDLKFVSVDGKKLKPEAYTLTQTQLILDNLPESFTLNIETVCNPSANSTLMGLYVSGGRFCTQCEAEGFRRMTYYPDRPDVLSVFTVRVEADRAGYIHLLANGNRVESGDLGNGRHYAVWEDPFPKPCYLFALVAGEFDTLEDEFLTQSGRLIPLTIFVDPGDAPRAEYAMDALKRSMKWDEVAFGREYDLDRFMIVAVRDFNFGAMENKGLNIFNSSLLLADAATATDMNFERIESVVAHEYFHNWTGNRITCRDWFQLCLKEGFTVFRDQEFSASQRGATVQRIKDVRALRSRQFPEDAGPLAHPVRPSEYYKIDNFYTATIYEKGAELIRMLKTLLGDDIFRKGSDLYFEKLDGTAATIEEFIVCFQQASGRDLSQFMRWYEEAGTPQVRLETRRSETGLTLSFTQSPPAIGNDVHPDGKVIPIRWQVVHSGGSTSDPMLTTLADKTADVTYDLPIDADVTVSVLQDFSAPVILKTDYNTTDFIRLMRHDPNGFNRWEAGQTLARSLMADMATSIEAGDNPAPNPALKAYVNALKSTLRDQSFDNYFKSLVLTPPAQTEIIQSLSQCDPIAVQLSSHWLQRAVADGLRGDLIETYHALDDFGVFSADAHSAGGRALRNRCLSLLASRQDAQAAPLAMSQFKTATNMTNELAALMTLTRLGGRRVDQSMQDFYEKWEKHPLVIDKWFAVAASREMHNPAKDLTELLHHPAYNAGNPNRVRSLLGSFAMNNPKGFHHVTGIGYSLFTQQIMDMDSQNPQIAARLLGTYEIWRKLDTHRQDLIRTELETIIASKPSKNTLEIAVKTLGTTG